MKTRIVLLSLCLSVSTVPVARAADTPPPKAQAQAPKRYLVTITHEPDECLEALHAFEQTDRPLFQKVEWGCEAGVHMGWVHVDAATAKAAIERLPADSREDARAVRVVTFSKASDQKHLQRNLDAERALQKQE